jgi:superoxide reductase
MTKVNQIYKCSVCGNIVEVKHAGQGELVCCNQPMNLVEANTQDAATEKHVPFIARDENGVHVQIGEALHPMDEDHYIEWITLVTNNKTKTVFLAPGDTPEARFATTAEKGTVYAYCNLHGLWKSEI